jgi:hypothetical protein
MITCSCSGAPTCVKSTLSGLLTRIKSNNIRWHHHILYCELINNSFSFLHLNIQSIVSKIDMISAEYSCHDILSFTENWLSQNGSTDQSIPDLINKMQRTMKKLKHLRTKKLSLVFTCNLCISGHQSDLLTFLVYFLVSSWGYLIYLPIAFLPYTFKTLV